MAGDSRSQPFNKLELWVYFSPKGLVVYLLNQSLTSCPGDKNSSRIYQLILKKMELLLSNVPSKNIIKYSAKSKGKKCASPNNSYDGPSIPKQLHCDLVKAFDDVNMAEVGEAGEGSA